MERCGKTDVLDPETGRPLCKLHGEPMRWDKEPRWSTGGCWKCRVRSREYSRRRYRDNKETEREKGRLRKSRWRQASPEHRERERTNNRRYLEKNREKLRQRQREYRKNNPEKVRESFQRWANANSDYRQDYNKKYRAANRQTLGLKDRINKRKKAIARDDQRIEEILAKYPDLEVLLDGCTP